MKKKISVLSVVVLAILVIMFTFSACASTPLQASAAPANQGSAEASSAPAQSQSSSAEKETYVWACQYNSLPLFVNSDYVGLDLAAKELNVEVKKIGPQEIDMPAMVAAIEQEIPKKPAGMMVVGWDASLATAIEKVYNAGIPVITVDADVPESKRIAFVGVDTYDAGYQQGLQAATKFADKTGNVYCFGVAGSTAHMRELEGYTKAMKEKCPNIKVDQQLYPSESNSQKVAEKCANFIQSDPNLVGFAGFDSTTGPGIAQAIQEAGKIGTIYGTCSDGELEHLQGVKSGALIACVGYKRQFNTYYGVKILYDVNHSPINFTKDDKGAGITNIPSFVNIGYIIGTKDNVDMLIAEKQAAAK